MKMLIIQSLALLPLGFALAGPVANSLGPRQVLGAGAVLSAVVLVAALTPRSTRSLPGPAQPSSSAIRSQ